MLRQQILNPIVAQTATTTIRKYDLPFTRRKLLQPSLQNGRRLLGQRRATFLPAFSKHMNIRSSSEMRILARQPGQFRQTQSHGELVLTR